ncbi:MAG: hypothetical protein HYZ39_01350 [Mycolicibacterium cosmeticum]|nr:hypothetical protein [Mycolicibacterium cosmeticum]
MKQFIVVAATFAALLAAEIGLAISAGAVPLGGSSADEAVNTLEAQGFTVRINQSVDVPLSECTVTNVSGLRGDGAQDPSTLNVAFLDVNCTPRS